MHYKTAAAIRKIASQIAEEFLRKEAGIMDTVKGWGRGVNRAYDSTINAIAGSAPMRWAANKTTGAEKDEARRINNYLAMMDRPNKVNRANAWISDAAKELERGNVKDANDYINYARDNKNDNHGVFLFSPGSPKLGGIPLMVYYKPGHLLHDFKSDRMKKMFPGGEDSARALVNSMMRSGKGIGENNNFPYIPSVNEQRLGFFNLPKPKK